ncbi:complement C1q-like protein 4 isoform X1 [Xyrichtys novacula]|uniref:Complement C1q-like protein 4 isoform X1 n=1 Tax=Xyrichtys novacula TaxID=13765 RepID=A0AAV1GQZ4_XYRNO|nr:complement C1q-like protein 4 isoform X1 [Xyrichtys novacula]
MTPTKVCFGFVVSATLFATSLTVAGSVDRTPRQAAVQKQGAAVLFYSEHQGSLREIEYNPVVFNHVVVNQGAGYSNVSGMFTAPVSGIYQFVFAAQLCRGNYNNVWGFMVRGERKMACHAQVSGGDTTLNTCYLMEELKKDDKVWMKQNPGSCAWASATSKTITFSGVLLASEGVSTLGAKYSPCSLPGVGNMNLGNSGLSAAFSSVAVTLLCCLLSFTSYY